MICAPCAHAGDKTRGGRLIPDVDKTETLRRGVEVTLRTAVELHATCKGCDCQHSVPSIDQLRREKGQTDRLTGVS
jgi:hypothetical protein